METRNGISCEPHSLTLDTWVVIGWWVVVWDGRGWGGGVEAVDVLCSSLFWAFTQLLAALHRAIDVVRKWSECCPCHSFFGGLGKDDWFVWGGMVKAQAAELRRFGEPSFQCPMRGKRSFELALGVVEDQT